MNLSASLTFAIVTSLAILTCITDCLRISKLTVPSRASIGEIIWLNCSFDLESDSLYSIKWYKDSEEMYRFVPSNSPPVMTYDVSGLKFITNGPPSSGHPHHLQLTTSSSLPSGVSGGCIRVAILTSDASGEFRCEVSAEAPSFQTSKRSSQLLVTSTKPGRVFSVLNSSYPNDLAPDHVTKMPESDDSDHFHTARAKSNVKKTNNEKDASNDDLNDSPVTATNSTLLNSLHQIFTGLSCCWKLIMGMSLVLVVTSVIFLFIKTYPCACGCSFCLKSKRRHSSLTDIANAASTSPITSASHSLLESTQFK